MGKWGMTNAQYKGMLIDQMSDWEEVLELAKALNATEIIKKAEKQINKIQEKRRLSDGVNG